MSKGNAISLNPETYTEGGGLVDDVDVIFNSCLFVLFDYNGKVSPGVPSLKVSMQVEDDEVEQYYSVGAPKDWMPSDDGKQILAVGSATGLRKTSNVGILLTSLVDAGFPAEDLGEDITVLDGLQAHMVRVPAPKRAGIKKDTEKKFDDTILIVSEIVSMPGEKKKPKGAPKGAGSKAAAPKGKVTPAAKKADAGGGDEDVNAKATEAIMNILAEAGTVTKKELPSKLFGVLKSDPDRNAIVKLAFDDGFLGSGPWTYEDETLVG